MMFTTWCLPHDEISTHEVYHGWDYHTWCLPRMRSPHMMFSPSEVLPQTRFNDNEPQLKLLPCFFFLLIFSNPCIFLSQTSSGLLISDGKPTTPVNHVSFILAHSLNVFFRNISEYWHGWCGQLKGGFYMAQDLVLLYITLTFSKTVWIYFIV